MSQAFIFFFFFFNDTATTEIYTLSLHDALPISRSADAAHHLDPCRLRVVDDQRIRRGLAGVQQASCDRRTPGRSEEHTSELQSPCNLVCRLLLEKKKK